MLGEVLGIRVLYVVVNLVHLNISSGIIDSKVYRIARDSDYFFSSTYADSTTIIRMAPEKNITNAKTFQWVYRHVTVCVLND